MKPYIICHMITSPDGGLHPSRWTKSPDGTRSEWSGTYETIHKQLDAQAWMVGRVTMAEMAKGQPHPPTVVTEVERGLHVADREATSFAIAVDQGGKVHFKGADLDGDHIIVLLGSDVVDAHLAELAADGISYIVSKTSRIDLAEMMAILRQQFGIDRLLLEGGGGINGSMMAAGLVDELSVLMAPALEAIKGADRFIEFGEQGLAGTCSLSLIDCQPAGSGLLHIRYRVSPDQA